MSDALSVIFLVGMITSALDGVFTVAVVKRGGCEVNPVVRFLVGRIGAPGAVSLTRVVICVLLFTFWMLRETGVVVSIVIVTACATVFTAKSVLASRQHRFGLPEIGEA
jgi:hypothetical protein